MNKKEGCPNLYQSANDKRYQHINKSKPNSPKLVRVVTAASNRRQLLFTPQPQKTFPPNNISVDRKFLTPVKKPFGFDNFMKSARKIDFNNVSMSPKITQVPDLQQKIESDYITNWIGEFIYNKEADGAARLIQQTFRRYREKKNWKGVIHHRIWKRLDALKRIFVGWRGYTSKDMKVISKCYDDFQILFREKPWLSMKSNLSPFALFYLSGKWFYPRSHSAREMYFTIRLFEHTNGRRMLRLWKSISHSIRMVRANNARVRFTITKQTKLGYIFNIFHVWYRFTMWKKLSKNVGKAFYLNCQETILIWNVKERQLNNRKLQQNRAARYSLQRIKKKAYNAVYQKYVDHLQELKSRDSSLSFYLNHLQARCRKAWSIYIAIQRGKRIELKKIMKAWYIITYRNAFCRHSLQYLTKYIGQRQLATIFHGWQMIAREEKLNNMKSSFLIQQKRSLPYFSIFRMIHKFHIHFFMKTWYEWIRYTRRKRKWQLFCNVFGNYNPDLEFKQKILFTLKMIGQNRRGLKHHQHLPGRFFPEMTPFSLVITVRMTQNIDNSIKQRNSDNDAQWSFLTQDNLTKPNKMSQSNINSNVLARCFLLKICEKNLKVDDNQKTVEEENENEEENQNETQLLTYDQIHEALQINEKKLRFALIRKIHRDTNIYCAVCSHFSAIAFNQIDEEFTINSTDLAILEGINLDDESDIQLIYNQNILDSIDNVILMNRKPRPILPQYRKELMHDLLYFKATYRHPRLFIKNFFNSNLLPDVTSESFGTKASFGTKGQFEDDEAKQQQQQTMRETLNTSLIIPYKQPNIDISTFPFEKPVLKEMKALLDNSSTVTFQKEAPISTFSIHIYQDLLSKMCFDDIANGLRRFFLNISDAKLDISNVVMYSREQSNCYNLIPLDNRHQVLRNIRGFIAQMNNLDITKTIPLSVESEQYVYDCVSAIFTVFGPLSKNKETQKFCEAYPFPELVEVDSVEVQSLRQAIVAKSFDKFPKMSKVLSDEIKKPQSSDVLELVDVHVSALLLPFIIKPGLIKNFLGHEVFDASHKGKM